MHNGNANSGLVPLGYTPEEVAARLCEVPPIQLLKPNFQFWKGLISLEYVIERLEKLLPPTFEDLEREFAVGVVDSKGQYRLINSGPLPEAVVASGAIPVLFAGVDIPGERKCEGNLLITCSLRMNGLLLFYHDHCCPSVLRNQVG